MRADLSSPSLGFDKQTAFFVKLSQSLSPFHSFRDPLLLGKYRPTKQVKRSPKKITSTAGTNATGNTRIDHVNLN